MVVVVVETSFAATQEGLSRREVVPESTRRVAETSEEGENPSRTTPEHEIRKNKNTLVCTIYLALLGEASFAVAETAVPVAPGVAVAATGLGGGNGASRMATATRSATATGPGDSSLLSGTTATGATAVGAGTAHHHESLLKGLHGVF